MSPITDSNQRDWQAMINNGMAPQVAFERMADWAAMLEDRLATFDPNYVAYPWGRNFVRSAK